MIMKPIQFSQAALSISTGFYLLASNTAIFLFERAVELSQFSEEVLRGERLPLLTLEDTQNESESQ